MTAQAPPQGARTSVWDGPTRLFHWSLVALIAFSWWSADARHMDWHRYSGYAVLGLLGFRLLWGVIGGSTARFATFVRSPAAVLGYLRGVEPSRHGHNPLGALSVLAMLVLLVAQVALGLFAVDIDGFESGPLSDLVSFEAGRWAAAWHHRVFNALLALIVLHAAAIAFYLVIRHDNLIGPMITGGRAARQGDVELHPASRRALVLACLLAVALAWAASKGFRISL